MVTGMGKAIPVPTAVGLATLGNKVYKFKK
jgi:hypothetical protein